MFIRFISVFAITFVFFSYCESPSDDFEQNNGTEGSDDFDALPITDQPGSESNENPVKEITGNVEEENPTEENNPDETPEEPTTLIGEEMVL